VKVLVIGADGFIGRHVAFQLREKGVRILAHARRPERLAAMGFETLCADLADPHTQTPEYWRPHLDTETHLVYAAGLLKGSDAAFAAVHELAPRAMVAALGRDAQAVLISAVGVDADTPFARWRRRTEDCFADHTILRPGLVLADTSYGGSSLLRALAANPWCTPVVGDGDQCFNPIHASDLAEAVHASLLNPPGPGAWDIGGPEVVTQAELMHLFRRWLGLAERPLIHIPQRVARTIGRIGDALQLGPVSATTVAQLDHGVLADAKPLLAKLALEPTGASRILMRRPAGTQDLWQARLYLLKPLVRLVLAVLWLASAALGLFLSPASFAPAVYGLPEHLAILLARGGGFVDAVLGIALLANWRPSWIAWLQIAVVAAYTIGLTLIAPALWLDPFGGLLKNLPILALMLVHLVLVEER
jgi:uncharacterized protein YbjT (DUF2867 family)